MAMSTEPWRLGETGRGVTRMQGLLARATCYQLRGYGPGNASRTCYQHRDFACLRDTEGGPGAALNAFFRWLGKPKASGLKGTAATDTPAVQRA